MKKFVVLLAVVAMICISSLAFAAAEVTVGGELAIRSRDFNDLNMVKNGSANETDTQERVRIDVNAKAGDVKGKISVWNYWENWGKFESPQANGTVSSPPNRTDNRLAIVEAWMSFNLPGLPVNITGGHQMLQLGHGWFFRSMYFGSDAWVVSNQSGNNTAAFVDVKVSEGATASADDVDAYVLLDVFKLNESNTIGIDITALQDRRGALGFGSAGLSTDLQNFSVNYSGKLGPVALKAQADFQMGEAKATASDNKFKGNEIVVQGSVALDPVTVNFTAARGSGEKSGTDIKRFVNFLDINPRYTFLYEYKIPTAAGTKNSGFTNTTALGVGATFAPSKSLVLGADAWYLLATEDTNVSQAGGPATNLSDDIGMEIDVKVNWKLYENLSWNWTLGYFMPGDAYKNNAGRGDDAATGIQGILAFKF